MRTADFLSDSATWKILLPAWRRAFAALFSAFAAAAAGQGFGGKPFKSSERMMFGFAAALLPIHLFCLLLCDNFWPTLEKLDGLYEDPMRPLAIRIAVGLPMLLSMPFLASAIRVVESDYLLFDQGDGLAEHYPASAHEVLEILMG